MRCHVSANWVDAGRLSSLHNLLEVRIRSHVSRVLQAAESDDCAKVPQLYGATNPFFLKRRRAATSIVTLAPQQSAATATSAVLQTATSGVPDRSVKAHSALLPRVTSTAGSLGRALFRSQSTLEPDVLASRADGLWLSYEPTCAGASQAVLAKLHAAQPPADGSQPGSLRRSQTLASPSPSAILRAHFYELTTAFLTPFCLYCGMYPPWDPRSQVRLRNPSFTHASMPSVARATRARML